eukprot:gb/GEZJ01003370.1/.p2 GENE.gb/GEZJ01003370.1/~~gb/GEZJ01003370.1/.p2  ORF type:complete len:140 (-),score=2.13 gb/GEZJ01003370.1/:458-877(-)
MIDDAIFSLDTLVSCSRHRFLFANPFLLTPCRPLSLHPSRFRAMPRISSYADTNCFSAAASSSFSASIVSCFSFISRIRSCTSISFSSYFSVISEALLVTFIDFLRCTTNRLKRSARVLHEDSCMSLKTTYGTCSIKVL